MGRRGERKRISIGQGGGKGEKKKEKEGYELSSIYYTFLFKPEVGIGGREREENPGRALRGERKIATTIFTS